MALLEAVVRSWQRLARGLHSPSLDEFGNFLVSQALPPYAKLAAAGKLYAVDTSAGTAKVPATAMPTTSPEWGLYNASSSETLVAILACAHLSSGTTGLGVSIVGAAAIGPQTAVTSDYASATKTCLDGSQKKGDFYIVNNPTLVGATPAWVPFDGTKMDNIAQVAVGVTLKAEVSGLLVAKPNGGMVAFEGVGAAGTSDLYDFMAIVAMLEMDL